MNNRKVTSETGKYGATEDAEKTLNLGGDSLMLSGFICLIRMEFTKYSGAKRSSAHSCEHMPDSDSGNV